MFRPGVEAGLTFWRSGLQDTLARSPELSIINLWTVIS